MEHAIGFERGKIRVYQYSLHQETTSAIKFQTVGGNSKVWKILP